MYFLSSIILVQIVVKLDCFGLWNFWYFYWFTWTM